MRTVTCYCGWFLGLILLVGLLPAHSVGAATRIESDTIFRVLERDTAAEEDATVLPVYEYLQIDTGELDDYGVSFHLYGWGRADLADSEYFEDPAAGEVLYGYVEYRADANQFGLRLGRQHVFEGVANETVDGLRLNGNLGDYFSLSVYGGQPVGLNAVQGSDGDSIVGGRLAHHNGSKYEIGVSFKASENDGETAEEMMGVDLALALPEDIRLSGYSAYNQESEDWAEQSWELRVPVGHFVLKPYYQHFSYEDYFATGANAVSVFQDRAASGEELTAYGLDALWQYDQNWTIGGKVKQHDYDQADSAQTYSVLAAWQGEELTQYGAEIGRTAAGDSVGNDYTLVRLYGYNEAMGGRLGVDFVSADLLLAQYDEEIYGKDSSLFLSLGGGKRFMGDALSVKLSGDYSQDAYFDEDVRGTLTVSYNFAQ
ncbi:MAG: hypothetical protein RRA15_12260 [bacterium]|nr:hypothetical protein [bacterium]MDT8367240.1 hypothetical protein [bacterium]